MPLKASLTLIYMALVAAAVVVGCRSRSPEGRVVCRGSTSGDATQIMAGRAFVCSATGLSCDETQVLLRVQNDDHGAVVEEHAIPWSSDVHSAEQALTVTDPGPYTIRILCDARPVALVSLTVACVRRPENVDEWMTSAATPGCIDRTWACEHLTESWYMQNAAFPPDYGLRIRQGEISLVLAIRRVYSHLRVQTGCDVAP
jgi:hypothetical protein